MRFRPSKNWRLAVLPVVTAFLFTLLAAQTARPAAAGIPPDWPCQEGEIEFQVGTGIVWVCGCIDPFPNVPEITPICEWFGEDLEEKQLTKEAWFRSSPTNSYNHTHSIVRINIGPPGNKAESAISIFGNSGNRIQKEMAARVIVKKWTGVTWAACHDSNWHHAPSARSDWWHVEPIDCGPGFYRAKSAGIYWSQTLGQWLGGGWVETSNLCAPQPTSCGTLALAFSPPPSAPTPDDPLDLPPAPK